MSQVVVERRGPASWVTFNRPEANNAMTFALYATKEALRRIRAASTPDGEDLIRAAYGSEGFRRNVARFLER